MAALPQRECRTLEACDSAYAERYNATRERRDYLGMSEIGRNCTRRLWYSFRWYARETFTPAQIKRFADGHLTEEVAIDRLMELKDLTVEPFDPETGEQWEFEDFGGHFAGHADGKITGVLEAPKTKHVLEIKCVNEKEFKKLKKLASGLVEKTALAAWSVVYHWQAQLYMHYTGTTRHFLVACTPGCRDWTSVRTDYNKGSYEIARNRVETILFVERLPDRISNDPEWWECKGCPFREICHENPAKAERNCRTCAHVTCKKSGGWECERLSIKKLSRTAQKEGCGAHAFHPQALWDREPVDSKEIGYRANVTYRLRDGSEWVDNGGRA